MGDGRLWEASAASLFLLFLLLLILLIQFVHALGPKMVLAELGRE
jgi:hypothetical protein